MHFDAHCLPAKHENCWPEQVSSVPSSPLVLFACIFQSCPVLPLLPDMSLQLEGLLRSAPSEPDAHFLGEAVGGDADREAILQQCGMPQVWSHIRNEHAQYTPKFAAMVDSIRWAEKIDSADTAAGGGGVPSSGSVSDEILTQVWDVTLEGLQYVLSSETA